MRILVPNTYDSFWISEFLINYQGGFVRRGLLGEILYFLVRHFNFDVLLTILIICLTSYSILAIFFVKSFLKRGYTLYILPLCFFMGALILNNTDIIRKDSLMVCFFVAMLWIYGKNGLSTLLKVLFINILAVFIILTHEVFVFFSIPLFFLLFKALYREKGKYQSIVLSAVSLLPSILTFFIVIIKHGNQATAQAIWDSWTAILNQAPSIVKYRNAIGALGWDSKWAFAFHFKQNFLIFNENIYSMFAWSIILPAVYYIATNALWAFRKNENDYTDRTKSVLSSLLIFQFLCLLPLFTVLSCDYMRVMFYCVTSSFAVLILVPTDTIERLIPSFFSRIINRINNYLSIVLPPTKTTLALLMLFIGMSAYSFDIMYIVRSTMIYNILLTMSYSLSVIIKFLSFLF